MSKTDRYDELIQKIADYQGQATEAIRTINHNTSETMELNKKMTDNMIRHDTQNSEEHKQQFNSLEKYFKLIIILIGVVTALVGVKLFTNI